MIRVFALLFFVVIDISTLFAREYIVDAEPRAKVDLWIGIAVGSPTAVQGTGRTLMYWGKAQSRERARYIALSKCVDEAFWCYELQPIERKTLCTYAHYGIWEIFNRATLLSAVTPETEKMLFTSACLPF